MKSFLNLLSVILFSSVVYSQNDFSKKNEEWGTYGKGGKKETRIFTYSDGGKDTIVRYFDPDGRLRYYTQTTVEKDGTVVEERTVYNCNGHKTKTAINKKDSTGALIYESEEEYNGEKKSKITKGFIIEWKGGRTTSKKEFDKDSGSYVPLVDVIIPPDWKQTSLEPDPTICRPNQTGIEIFAGYSNLLANFKPENESLHGWAASAFYNFNPRWSAGLYGSGHYKSPENQKFSMYFLHAALRYDFLNSDRKENRFNPYLSLGLGISTYKSEVEIPGINKFTTDDKSFTPMFGAGVDWELVKRMALQADVSYVPTHFSDETQHNVRASVGVNIPLFRARKEFGSGN